MNNLESIYYELKRYFNADKEKINHLLVVLKNVKEDKWQLDLCLEKYNYQDILFDFFIKTIRYDDIKIMYSYFQDGDRVFNSEIKILVDDKYIYNNTFEDDTIFIELKAFVERVEEREK